MSAVRGLWGGDDDEEQPSAVPASAPDSAAPKPQPSDIGKQSSEPSQTSKYFEKNKSEEQSATTETLKTLAEAYGYCTRLAIEQVEKAAATRALQNVAIAGDKIAQTTIQLLLPDELIRRLFIQLSKTQQHWARLSPLFGAPPYYFLHPGDAGGVRAGGFAHARVRMTYDQMGQIPSTSQFEGQFVDQYGRTYKVHMRPDISMETSLPGGVGNLDAHTAMYVRVKKRSATKTKDASTPDERKPFLLPRPGDVLELRETPQLRRLRGLREATTVSIRVVSSIPRNHNATSNTGVIRYSITI